MSTHIYITTKGRTVPGITDGSISPSQYKIITNMTTISANSIGDCIAALPPDKKIKIHVMGEVEPWENFPLNLLGVMMAQLSNENMENNDPGRHLYGILSCEDQYDQYLTLMNVVPNSVELGSAERMIQQHASLYGI